VSLGTRVKVFVSHSSADRWIAKQIAQQLEDRDIAAFLDEKDIETGDSIEDAVDAHLADCDELLILLSPASLGSAWVLIEVGGAKALGKRLVPILHHVGANELPIPLSRGLARELNDVETYYAEVIARSKLPEAKREAQNSADAIVESPQPIVKVFVQGDRVRLPLREPRVAVTRDGRDIGWNPEMSALLGAEATVISADTTAGHVHVDADSGRWIWLMDWLTSLGD
jgi:hypothetical protein